MQANSKLPWQRKQSYVTLCHCVALCAIVLCSLIYRIMMLYRPYHTMFKTKSLCPDTKQQAQIGFLLLYCLQIF